MNKGELVDIIVSKVKITNRNCKVFVTDILQKLVFKDEEGNTVFQTDGSLVGKIIEVRFKSLH